MSHDVHPAHRMSFADLVDGLRAAREQRLVSEYVSQDGLRLYCYSNSCVYDQQWTDITMSARGLIIDPARQRIVATPFPKFFNLGERGDTIPDLPFDTFEKLDGSLIILFHHAGEWRTATKGSFDSAQARWADAWLAGRDLSGLSPTTTYLAEAIYPENRIVVRYSEPDLVLLAAYDENGMEAPYDSLVETGGRLRWRVAGRQHYASVTDLMVHTRDLPASSEGFVLRFHNGLRLKIKGEAYRRIHALISRVTPLALWEAMEADDDLEQIRRDLPEEYWTDFDEILRLIEVQLSAIQARVKDEADTVAHLSDKDVGLRLKEFAPDVRPFIFGYRRSGGNLMSGRSRNGLFRAIRPTGNELPGYVPSYAMHRILDDV
jgi:RNA ligase